MNLRETNKFVKDRGILLPNKQVMLTEPLFVFKKIKNNGNLFDRDCIANLVIPAGAIVNLAQDGEHKMRASQAYCHSIATMRGERQITSAKSGWDSNFEYISGTAIGLKTSDFDKLVADAEKYVKDIIYNNKKLLLSRCKCVPTKPFITNTSTCASGIHFFIDLKLAKAY